MRAEEITPRRGDVLRAVKTKKGPRLKVKGLSALLGVGDIVEIDTGPNYQIIEILFTRKLGGIVRLEDGKFYSPTRLRYPMDDNVDEANGTLPTRGDIDPYADVADEGTGAAEWETWTGMGA